MRADEDWRVAVSLPEPGELPIGGSGTTDWASPMIELSNLTEIDVSYEGDDQFLLFVFRDDGARLYAPVDRVGAFDEPIRFRTAPGHYIIAVETLGPWSLDVHRTYSDADAP